MCRTARLPCSRLHVNIHSTADCDASMSSHLCFSHAAWWVGIVSNQQSHHLCLPRYLHLTTSEIWCWSGGRGILTQLSLCYSTVFCYNGAQRSEQFSQVGRLHQALIVLGWALCLNPIFRYIVDHLVSWVWWHWSLTSLTSRCPSVLWRCWLGDLIWSDLTCKISD